MTVVPVYINWGQFVADCPCGDARHVQPGDRSMRCVDGHQNDLEWQDDAPRVMAALGERVSTKRRNWFPRNHPLAVAAGWPHGQTVDEIRAETQFGEAADAADLATRRTHLLAQMRALGVTVDEALTALKGV